MASTLVAMASNLEAVASTLVGQNSLPHSYAAESLEFQLVSHWPLHSFPSNLHVPLHLLGLAPGFKAVKHMPLPLALSRGPFPANMEHNYND